MKVRNLKERKERNVTKPMLQEEIQHRRRENHIPIPIEEQTQIHTEKKHSKKKSRNKQKKASTGKEYVFIAYSFVGIFLALIG